MNQTQKIDKQRVKIYDAATVCVNMRTPTAITIDIVLNRNSGESVGGAVELNYQGTPYELRVNFERPNGPNGNITVTDSQQHPLSSEADFQGGIVSEQRQFLVDFIVQCVHPRALEIITGTGLQLISGNHKERFIIGTVETRQNHTQFDLVVTPGNEKQIRDFFSWLDSLQN